MQTGKVEFVLIQTVADRKFPGSLGFNFSGVDTPKNSDDTYGLRQVKAVQEKRVIIENLKKDITEQLITLRNEAGMVLRHTHKDDTSNTFMGRDAGQLNTPSGPKTGT